MFKREQTSESMADYADQSLLKTDISAIYKKQNQAPVRMKIHSTYKDKRNKSRNSSKDPSKEKSKDKSRQVKKKTVKGNSSNSSRLAGKKKDKMLGSQIEHIGKIAQALVHVDPHLVTLGKKISTSTFSRKTEVS